MKRKLVVIVLLFLIENCYAQSQIVNTFLDHYFNSKYNVEQMKMGKNIIYVGYHLVDGSKIFGIFDKAIIFCFSDNSIKPLVYINSNGITSAKGETIYNISLINQFFFGWTMKIDQKKNSFNITYYYNNATDYTFATEIIWDENDEEFFN
jgi:hypothetical protein